MRKMAQLLSVVIPCYNEEENVNEVYEQVKSVFVSLPQYDYEHIFIDNCSKDKTVTLLKEIALRDKNVKIIVNSRNFGHIRSPYHGLMSAYGDAVISIVADLQDPPHMIKDFLENWEKGYKIVVGIKAHSEESWLFFRIRRLYYFYNVLLNNYTL
jgi:glycosyltransferase involved in cell wall biosynthesis